MAFSADILQENLARALASAKPVATRRQATVTLAAEGGSVRVHAEGVIVKTDLWIGAHVHDGGTVTLDYKPLTRFIKNLPPMWRLYLRASDTRVTISGEGRIEAAFDLRESSDSRFDFSEPMRTSPPFRVPASLLRVSAHVSEHMDGGPCEFAQYGNRQLICGPDWEVYDA